MAGDGAKGAMRTAGNTVEAPFLAAAYVALVPLAFIYGMAVTIGDAAAWTLHKRA